MVLVFYYNQIIHFKVTCIKGNMFLIQLIIASNLLLMDISGQKISDFFKPENNPISKGIEWWSIVVFKYISKITNKLVKTTNDHDCKQ